MFEPIVNQGARLGGITKLFGCKVCFDKQTAEQLAGAEMFSDKPVRQLATLQPAGMEDVIDVFTLVTPEDESMSAEPEVIEGYQQALGSFRESAQQEVRQRLQPWVDQDSPSRGLFDHVSQFRVRPPDGWQGAIQLSKK